MRKKSRDRLERRVRQQYGCRRNSFAKKPEHTSGQTYMTNPKLDK